MSGDWEVRTPVPHRCYDGLWPPGAEQMGVGSIWRCRECGRGWQVVGIVLDSLRTWREVERVEPKAGQG